MRARRGLRLLIVAIAVVVWLVTIAAPTGSATPIPSVSREREASPGEELVARRTADTRTFATDEPGEFKTLVYSEPVHEWDGDRWVSLRPTFESVAEGFRSAGSAVPMSVLPSGGETVVTVEVRGTALPNLEPFST